MAPPRWGSVFWSRFAGRENLTDSIDSAVKFSVVAREVQLQLESSPYLDRSCAMKAKIAPHFWFAEKAAGGQVLRIDLPNLVKLDISALQRAYGAAAA
jgi:hypothetical protein